MRRFFTRHMSLRKHGHYTLLSCSDSQLNRTLKTDSKEQVCDRPDEVDVSNITRTVSQRRRRWYKLPRRKKRRESEIAQGREGATLSASAHEDFEIGIEASPCHDEDDTYAGHATLTRSVSTSMLDIRNAGIDVEQYAEVNPAVMSVHEHFAQMHIPNTSGLKPAHLESRRFAICEELEREIIMDDGVNLRKSRKNLVIRQVLHDLLLL